MSAPHAPKLEYLCDDPDCCDNGCPRVECRSCGEEWPCADWCSRHSAARVRAQIRYVERKWHPDDPEVSERTLDRLLAAKMAAVSTITPGS